MLVIFQEEGLCDLHACRGMHVGYNTKYQGSKPYQVKVSDKKFFHDFPVTSGVYFEQTW